MTLSYRSAAPNSVAWPGTLSCWNMGKQARQSPALGNWNKWLSGTTLSPAWGLRARSVFSPPRERVAAKASLTVKLLGLLGWASWRGGRFLNTNLESCRHPRCWVCSDVKQHWCNKRKGCAQLSPPHPDTASPAEQPTYRSPPCLLSTSEAE